MKRERYCAHRSFRSLAINGIPPSLVAIHGLDNRFSLSLYFVRKKNQSPTTTMTTKPKLMKWKEWIRRRNDNNKKIIFNFSDWLNFNLTSFILYAWDSFSLYFLFFVFRFFFFIQVFFFIFLSLDWLSMNTGVSVDRCPFAVLNCMECVAYGVIDRRAREKRIERKRKIFHFFVCELLFGRDETAIWIFFVFFFFFYSVFMLSSTHTRFNEN